MEIGGRCYNTALASYALFSNAEFFQTSSTGNFVKVWT